MSVNYVSIAPPSRRPSADESREFSRFYRWGWLPLAGGTFVLCVAAIVLWDVVARARGVEVTPELRTLFAARAFVLSAVVAAWSGFFVHRTRRRIEQVREELMVERASLVEQRRRLEQTEGVAAILRVMAHEIRNPLNHVRLHAGVVRRAIDKGQLEAARECAEELDRETVRLAELVDEYMELGHADANTVDLQPVDVRGPIRAAVEAHRAALERQGISVILEMPDDELSVEAEPKKLGEVVHKLLRNASEAMRDRGHIAVRVRRDEARTPVATIEISDTGPGFADPTAAFRPFYSTKPEGTGLGLSIVHDLVRAHRGEVCAFNNDSGGACVRIRLPLREDRCPE